MQASEEAVIGALLAGETMVGIDGRRSSDLPGEQVAAIFAGCG